MCRGRKYLHFAVAITEFRIGVYNTHFKTFDFVLLLLLKQVDFTIIETSYFASLLFIPSNLFFLFFI